MKTHKYLNLTNHSYNMTLSVDMRVRPSDQRGIYYEETERAVVYLPMHESLDDILKTINHEVYHHCFGKIDELTIDEDQEELLIFQLAWADHSLR